MEKDIEKYFVEKVKEKKGVALKFLPMLNPGWPDRLAIFPGWKIHFVELKYKGKKPNPLQMIIHKKIANLGGFVPVLDSKEKIDQFINGI